MAWVELVPIGFILIMVGWIFLRPYPGDKNQQNPSDSEEQSKTAEHQKSQQHQLDKDDSDQKSQR